MPESQDQENLGEKNITAVEQPAHQALPKSRLDAQGKWRQKDPLRGLIWGLLLILVGVLFFANEQQWLTGGLWWEALVIGLGAVFIIDALFHYFNPAARPYTPGRLSPGIILLAIGIVLMAGFATWWPVALIATGAALFFSSWVLQREIERRTSTQVTLQQSERRYRQIIDNANSLILEMDTRGNVTFINKFAREFFGYKEEEIVGRNALGTIIPETEQAREEHHRMLAEITLYPENYLHIERENILHNGNKAWVVWTNKPIFDETKKLSEILCIGIDSTEKRKAEILLEQQLKERTAMEERNRLARDLHDAVSQTLFSASIIADVLPKIWERSPEEGRKRLREIRQLTRGALAEMRTLLLELRPVALKDAELGELLKQLGESINGRARIPVEVHIEGNCELGAEVKTALYRIAQEALNNVAKHSGAEVASVNLTCQPEFVRLVIRDNGKGFEPGIKGQSLGLGIMSERAREINAQLSLQSTPGEGTTVSVHWKNPGFDAQTKTGPPAGHSGK
ncbi:MAG TPA: PAS domain S-box protein [Dehalococcoidales bacterium]|nr:PAS domain S-box protein [Dehalococcoidales bacterium]